MDDNPILTAERKQNIINSLKKIHIYTNEMYLDSGSCLRELFMAFLTRKKMF